MPLIAGIKLGPYQILAPLGPIAPAGPTALACCP